MAYNSDETGSSEVYLRPFLPGVPGAPAGARTRVSTHGGEHALWRGDGQELFYIAGETLMAVDVKLGNPPEIGVPHKLFNAPTATSSGYTVFRDGQRFFVIEPVRNRLAQGSMSC